MARTSYYYDFAAATLIGDGTSLDASTALVMGNGNAEALYECLELDISIVFPRYLQCATGGTIVDAEDVDGACFIGPFIIPARKDRDGLYRALKITPLCIGGTSSHTLRCFALQRFQIPQTYEENYCSWTVASGTTLVWQTEGTIIPTRDSHPHGYGAHRDITVGRENANIEFWWLLFKWYTYDGATGPRFAGLRVREAIA